MQLLLEAPESHIHGLDEMLQLAQSDRDPVVQRYAVAGLTTVYKDILPGYRIRTLTDHETSVKVSKAVSAQRASEQGLVHSYQAFVQLLDKRMDDVFRAVNYADEAAISPAARVDAKLYVTSVCTLVIHKPHFNFSTDLIKWILRGVNSKNERISSQCYDAMVEVFDVDGEKEITLAAIGLIASLMQAKKFSASPKLVQLFGELRLLDAVPQAVTLDGQRRSIDEVLQPHLSGKQRKELKARRKREMALAKESAEVSKYERQLLQTDILSRIMLAYFRVLKKAPHSRLLPAVLAGLEKHAHLVNVEFTGDLFAALAAIVADPSIRLVARCYAIHTALGLVDGLGSAFQVDLKDFYIGLYTTLAEVRGEVVAAATTAQRAALQPTLTSILTNLERAFAHLGRELAAPRVAAILKRMASLATVTPVGFTISIIWMIRKVMLKAPLLHQLLESEKTSMGAFDDEVDDPHHANGLAATLFELMALANSHWHPKVRSMAAAAVALEPIPVRQSSIKATKFVNVYDVSKGTFNPAIPKPGAHSLSRIMRRWAKKSKGAHRFFFLPTDGEHDVGPVSAVAAPIADARVLPPKSTRIFGSWLASRRAAAAVVDAQLTAASLAAQREEIAHLRTVFNAVRAKRKRDAEAQSASGSASKRQKRK